MRRWKAWSLSLSKLSQHGTFIPLGAHASYANRCPTQNLLCRHPRGLIGRPAVPAQFRVLVTVRPKYACRK
jgi:hypothetical protein